MKLTYGQIQDIASQLKSSSNEMNDILNQVKSLFENVGEGNAWSGTSAAETKAKFDELSAKFPEFYQAIDECHKYLLRVVENYQNVDRAVTGN